MDAVKKYLFWVCTPLGLLVAVTAGWLAIGSIASDLEAKKKELDNQRTAVTNLKSGAASHPNQGTIDAVNEAKEQLMAKVLTAWETLVAEQQKQNRWTGFADVAIREIESKNFLDPLSSQTRLNYLAFAKEEINKLGGMNKALPELANEPGPSDIWRVQSYGPLSPGGPPRPVEPVVLTESRSTSGGSGSSGGGFRRPGSSDSMSSSSTSSTTRGNLAAATDRVGKVVWDAPQLDLTMTDWSGDPKSFEVWFTQEDLWVYQALFWVVAEANRDVPPARKAIAPGGAGGGTSGTRPTSGGSGQDGDPLNLRNSVVKEIIELAIGQNAAVELDRQTNRRIASGAGMSSGGAAGGSVFGGRGGYSGGDSSSGDSYGGSGGTLDAKAREEAAQKAALMGRYVDTDGSILLEPDLTTGQFRRMPVYLKLRVDQRRISDVLAHCANCPMPIDVLWVTVNPDATESFAFASAAGSSGSYGGSGDGGGSSGGSGRTRQSSGSTAASRTSGGRTGNVDFGPDEVTIEILGCINIFTPPEAKKLSGGT